MTIEEKIRTAVRSENPLMIKYWPNQNGRELTGWRSIMPLKVFSHRGKQYLFSWFSEGSSDSGLSGYRLYFMKNVRDLKFVDQSTGKSFVVAYADMKRHTQPHNVDYLCKMMALRGQIE